MVLDEIVALSVKHNAADLHLCSGHLPHWRRQGVLEPIPQQSALDGGWLDGERGNISGGKLGGSALGIAAEGRGFSQSLSAAKPLAYPRGLHPDSWVMYWQVGVRL